MTKTRRLAKRAGVKLLALQDLHDSLWHLYWSDQARWRPLGLMADIGELEELIRRYRRALGRPLYQENLW